MCLFRTDLVNFISFDLFLENVGIFIVIEKQINNVIM